MRRPSRSPDQPQGGENVRLMKAEIAVGNGIGSLALTIGVVNTTRIMSDRPPRARDIARAELEAALNAKHQRYRDAGLTRCPNCGQALTDEPTKDETA
jgi:hypothetical protein